MDEGRQDHAVFHHRRLMTVELRIAIIHQIGNDSIDLLLLLLVVVVLLLRPVVMLVARLPVVVPMQ